MQELAKMVAAAASLVASLTFATLSAAVVVQAAPPLPHSTLLLQIGRDWLGVAIRSTLGTLRPRHSLSRPLLSPATLQIPPCRLRSGQKKRSAGSPEASLRPWAGL